MNKRLALLCLIAAAQVCAAAGAYESLYPKTPAGEIEIKQLPERVMLRAAGEDNYFKNDDGLFRKLFRFISDNEIAMTVPVEVQIQPGSMAFFVGEKDQAKAFSSTDEVTVNTLPARAVAAIGYRGAYTKDRYIKNREKLTAWLSAQKAYTVAGKAYAVYWHGPFTPWFLKRAEVHIPVHKAEGTE